MTEQVQGGRFAAENLACIRGERPVFSGLDFTLESGGALLLHGPNGSGKSSLLRILAGFLRPVDGRLTWNGAPIGDAPEAHRGRLHFVGHLDAVKPTLTVAENLLFWARLRSHPQAAGDALAHLGLEALADVPGRFLSAGQRRRAALARLFATPAPLWLLDEPTVTLDADATGRLEDVVRAHRAAGGMVVVATHTEFGLEHATRVDMGAHTVSVETVAGAPAGDGPDAAGVEDEPW
jgi:heme exporter protein A